MKPPMKRWTQPGSPLLAIMSHRKGDYFQPDARHQEHEMNIALGGDAVYRLDGGEPVRLKAGEILLMPAGVIHSIEVERELRMAAIHIHPAAMEEITATSDSAVEMLKHLRSWKKPPPPRKVVDPEANITLERLAEDALLEQSRGGIADDALLRFLGGQAAVHFLRLMLSEASDQAIDEPTRRILTVRSWIDRHFAEDCEIADLAKMAHLAPTYFAARFRSVVGQAPITYIRNRRLQRARSLLQRTAQPVKVIAWSVGFSDMSHFNRAFRRDTGMTPLAYRQMSDNNT